MKDLKKVQEFFSKPLEEVTNDYSPLSYAKLVANGKMEMEDAMKETGLSYVLLKQLVDKVKNVAQNIREEQETGVGMVKKQLDALGVKYEMSKTDKVRPFKVIYQPINKSDEFYDKFKNIVDLFNLKGVVKLSMNEAKQEDPTDIIAMDVPLFLRMLEYAREDAEQDVDLHKVTERAIEAVKLRGLLSMEDYDSLIGESIQDIDEAKLPGLWANIRAKRERGEKPSSKGSKAYKTAVAAGKRINKEK